MNLIEDTTIACPFCGESFAIEVDTEEGSYTTIEDCAVCCRPLALTIRCHRAKWRRSTWNPANQLTDFSQARRMKPFVRRENSALR